MAFPVALVMGMTWEQYWLDDPWLFCAYREAERQRTQRTHETAWLNGLYTYVAIGRLVPVLRAFSKARKPLDYPQVPFGSDEERVDAAKEAGRSHRQLEFMAQLRKVAERDSEKR